jgi:hypothetical protein
LLERKENALLVYIRFIDNIVGLEYSLNGMKKRRIYDATGSHLS